MGPFHQITANILSGYKPSSKPITFSWQFKCLRHMLAVFLNSHYGFMKDEEMRIRISSGAVSSLSIIPEPPGRPSCVLQPGSFISEFPISSFWDLLEWGLWATSTSLPHKAISVFLLMPPELVQALNPATTFLIGSLWVCLISVTRRMEFKAFQILLRMLSL